MSRKGQTPVRDVIADPKHGSEMVARFINMVMKSGMVQRRVEMRR